MDANMLRDVLEELNLATGIKVEAVVDLVEPHREGGLTLSELIAALQSAAPGVQVRLPSRERDTRARQQVRWQMAPFHKSTIELRAHIREKAPTDQDDRHTITGPPANLTHVNAVAETPDTSGEP